MPLTASARSDSIVMRRPRPYPPCRRRSSTVIASKSMVSPAGTPSRIATSVLPCDSPAVRNRSIRLSFYPNFLQRPGSSALVFREITQGRGLALVQTVSVVADRFLVTTGERAIDLATGLGVVIRMGAAGTEASLLEWTARCD